ncbi:hypothetical protein J1605_000776 [Eschrichtius robustus]|uniref:Uncharacterized protein n=1 Tax=Eschrichtius robustus TaxID=9764 RepID=A0AB34GN90_ESCRO|nr:hypothetical protein J1605_000776 [Eschrichtius robustus]
MTLLLFAGLVSGGGAAGDIRPSKRGGQDGVMWTDAHSHGAGYSPAPPGTTGDLPPAPHSSPEAQAELCHIPDLKSLGTSLEAPGVPLVDPAAGDGLTLDQASSFAQPLGPERGCSMESRQQGAA